MNKQEITEFRKSLDIPDRITDDEISTAAEGTTILALIRLRLAGRQLKDAIAEQTKPKLEKTRQFFAKKLGF